MNEKRKIEYYRRQDVVTRFNHRRFDGPSGKWVSDIEKKKTIALLGDPDGLCLDLACGQGRLGMWLDDAGWNVTGLDSSMAMLKDHRGKRILGDAFHLPFRSGIFSGVASLRFLFHLADPEPLFKEISRILVNGGRFVVDPLNWTIRTIVPQILDGSGGPISSHSERRISALAAFFQLKLVKTEPLFMFPPSILRFFPLSMVNFLEQMARRLKLPPSRYLALFVKGLSG